MRLQEASSRQLAHQQPGTGELRASDREPAAGGRADGHDAPPSEPGQQGEHGEPRPGPGDDGDPRLPGGRGTEVDLPDPEPNKETNQETRQGGKQPGSGGPEDGNSPDPAEKREVPSTDRRDDDPRDDDSREGGIVGRIVDSLKDILHGVEYRDGMTVIRVRLDDGTTAEVYYREVRVPTLDPGGNPAKTEVGFARYQDSRHGDANEADDDDD
jgi:hypothetical protein